jgi:hypothetical protein
MAAWHAFQDGGWAMWAIFGFGLVGVGAAGRFAWRGEHQLAPFLRWIVALLGSSGLFGFFVGVQKMLSFAGDRLSDPDLPPTMTAVAERRIYVLLVGTREAMGCLSGALMFIVVVCLLAAVGYRRFPFPNAGAVAR